MDIAALQTGPSRRRAQGVTVYLLAFDLLACEGTDLRGQPYRHRRTVLQHQLQARASGRIQPVPATTDLQAAQEWMDPAYDSVGIEGVIAKSLEGRYGDRRSGWWKTRMSTTEEAIILGVTGHSVVLGRPRLRHMPKIVGDPFGLHRLVVDALVSSATRLLAGRLDEAITDLEFLPQLPGDPNPFGLSAIGTDGYSSVHVRAIQQGTRLPDHRRAPRILVCHTHSSSLNARRRDAF